MTASRELHLHLADDQAPAPLRLTTGFRSVDLRWVGISIPVDLDHDARSSGRALRLGLPSTSDRVRFTRIRNDPHRRSNRQVADLRLLRRGSVPSPSCGWAQCPACQATAWQGSPKYPGVDVWENGVVEAGVVLLSIGSGSNGFFTTLSALLSVNCDVTGLCRGLQIAQPSDGERGLVSAVQVVRDQEIAAGIARANIQYGSGGLPQIYVPMDAPAGETNRIAG